MNNFLKILFFSLFFTNCSLNTSDITDFVDLGTFKYFGSTFFDDAQFTTIKDLHLNGARIVPGKKIIFEGTVVEIDRYLTYIVMSDDNARMLVLLTDITSVPATSTQAKIKIFGEVSRGKKGIPYVIAKSYQFIL